MAESDPYPVGTRIVALAEGWRGLGGVVTDVEYGKLGVWWDSGVGGWVSPDGVTEERPPSVQCPGRVQV